MTIPTFFFVETSLTDDASRRAAQRENSARPAVVEMTHITTNVGQHRVTEPLRFPITFRSEPHLTTGCATVRHPSPSTWHDPVGSAGIWAWLRDDNGNFLGAYIWLRVDMYPVDSTNTAPPPVVTAQHCLTFSGVAIKDLPTHALDPSLPPRSVGL